MIHDPHDIRYLSACNGSPSSSSSHAVNQLLMRCSIRRGYSRVGTQWNGGNHQREKRRDLLLCYRNHELDRFGSDPFSLEYVIIKLFFFFLFFHTGIVCAIAIQPRIGSAAGRAPPGTGRNFSQSTAIPARFHGRCG